MYKVTVSSSSYQSTGADFTFGQLFVTLLPSDARGEELAFGPYPVFRLAVDQAPIRPPLISLFTSTVRAVYNTCINTTVRLTDRRWSHGRCK